MKIQKKIFIFFLGGGSGRGGQVGGVSQGGCERRSEAFVKIQKQIFGGWDWGGGGLRGKGRRERGSEAFVKIQEKWGIGSGGGRRVEGGGGSGWM